MRVVLAIITSLLLTLLASWSPAKAAVPEKKQLCSLSSEGLFNGEWVKHRISAGDSVVYGANDMETLLSHLVSLRDQGLCR